LTTRERAEFQSCDLRDADFYGGRLPSTSFLKCDLAGVELSKADVAGSRLNGSTFEGIKGAESLRGVIIGSEQVIPTALAVFGALNIVVDDANDENDAR
jgi:uncharacterized protein YjbI with pentapeptide repeats